MIKEIELTVGRRGLHEITSEIQQLVQESGLKEGLCTLFIRNTSASLLIQENADPSCQRDLEEWMERLVPRGDPLYTHIDEGLDDMPGHIKSMLTQSSLSVPVVDGRLPLGTWQGIFLWEHRERNHTRKLMIHLGA